MTQPESPARLMRVWEWPSRDRTAWGVACEPCNPFDASRGRASIWKPSTRKNYQDGYGRWLAWLEATGDLERGASSGERASEDSVRAYCRSLQGEGLAPYTVAGALMGLSRVLAVLEPDMDFRWISIASRRLHSEARPVKDVTDCFQPIEDVLKLAYELMWEAEHGRFRSPFQKATLFRDGLMIALLAHRPLRITNFASIHLGQQLERFGDGWRLSFSPEEMKAGRAYECPWPDVMDGALEKYLGIHRKVLMDGQGDEGCGPLWVSRETRAMTPADIRLRVMKWTGEEFGVAINPHAFRHLVATTIATHDSDNASGIPAILDHGSQAASETYYNMAKQLDASRQHQAVVAALRQRKPPRSRPKLSRFV